MPQQTDTMYQRLAKLHAVDMPAIRSSIQSIGPSLSNAQKQIENLANVVSFVVRYLVTLGVPGSTPDEAPRMITPEEVAAIAALPAGTTIPMPSQEPQTNIVPQTLNVIVGAPSPTSPVTTVVAPQPDLDPEPEDLPMIINKTGGRRRVIPARGSSAQAKDFGPHEQIDLSQFMPMRMDAGDQSIP